jgi:hypothetical protein
MASDHLDELLDRSAPQTTPITPGVADELKHLRAATETAARQPRRWARPVVAGFAALLFVGGAAAAAAAATGIWTLPWAEDDAIASFHYTLPSGIECEQRIGGVSGTVPAAITAVQDFYRSADFDALLTDEAIQAAIEKQRQGGGIHVNDDGSRVPGGYGTEFYDADREYLSAVWDVVVTAMDTDLARQGLAGVDNELTLQSEPNCPGAAW